MPGLGWGDREDAPAPGFEILGGPRDGTYAELVALPDENLFPKPAGLSWAEAAAFPLAAVTAYPRPLLARRPGVGRDGARARRGQRRLDVRRVSWRRRRVPACSSRRRPTRRSSGRGSSGAEAGVNYATTPDWAGGGPGARAGRSRASTPSARPGSSRSTPCAPAAASSSSAGRAGPRSTLQVRPFYFRQQSLYGTQLGSPRDFDGAAADARRGDVEAGARLGPAARRGRGCARPPRVRPALRQARAGDRAAR